MIFLTFKSDINHVLIRTKFRFFEFLVIEFSLNNKTAKLKTLKFKISQNNFDTVTFRINIYSVKNGKPENRCHI